MTTRAEQLIPAPSWVPMRGEPRRLGSVGAARFTAGGSFAREAAGAALVLGGSVALWAAFLAAVW
jgi:hypothetical protein